MLEVGFLLEERYEILEVVGTGGMSTVYKARDKRLKRFVAVKVLKSEYNSDMNFVAKFRAEAQASAGLTHPNIVSVYDVGEDSGRYFIVMELVEGITLKEYIRLNGRLSMDQTIDFSIQIASGLEMAHENHIIHRDIKPQNIIVAKNGNLKVTDFGIAKAATSNTMSTLGMGSVHYISPEQARGGYSDERSDIYSLGITMYEMVTGRVPYEGETNVAIALKHINNEIIPPRQLYPDIYSSLEKIILKATQKKPERRYLTSAALIADLRRVKANPNIDIIVAGGNVTNDPTQKFTTSDVHEINENTEALKNNTSPVKGSKLEKLLNEDDDYDFDEDVQNSRPASRRDRDYDDYRDDEHYRGNRRDYDDYDDYDDRDYDDRDYDDRDYDRDYDDRDYDDRRSGHRLKKVPDDDYYDDDRDYRGRDYRGRDYDRYDDEGYDDERNKTDKVVMIAGVAAAIIITIIIIIVAGSLLGWFGKKDSTTEDKSVTTEATTTEEQTTEAKEVKMPDVVGRTQEAAEKMLKDAGFTNVKVNTEASKDVVKGYVISQSVNKDTMAKPDTEVVIVVSLGPSSVKIPDLAGRTDDEATKILEELGFKVTHSYRYDDNVEKDKVISTSPEAGQEAAEGSEVVLYVSNGQEVKQVAVPDVTGISQTAAESSLKALKLVLGNVTKEYSDTVEAGLVISQGIAENTMVNEGTAVDIVISLGKKQLTYKGTVSGNLTLRDEHATDVAVLNKVNIVVCIADAEGEHMAYSTTIAGGSATIIEINQTISGLKYNNGSVTYTITDENGNDISAYFINNINVNYAEE